MNESTYIQECLSLAIPRRKKINKERVKVCIDQIKRSLQIESDPDIREHLALAGLELNRRLIGNIYNK